MLSNLIKELSSGFISRIFLDNKLQIFSSYRVFLEFLVGGSTAVQGLDVVGLQLEDFVST